MRFVLDLRMSSKSVFSNVRHIFFCFTLSHEFRTSTHPLPKQCPNNKYQQHSRTPQPITPPLFIPVLFPGKMRPALHIAKPRAIFRVFSDSPPFQCNLQPPWPATAPSETTGDDLLSSCRRGHLCIGRASREKQIGSHSHIQSQSYGQLQDGGVSLPAFLKVCRRARLILSARAAWSKEQRGDDGTLKGIYAKQKGALVIECGYRGGKGECGERLEAAASPKVRNDGVTRVQRMQLSNVLDFFCISRGKLIVYVTYIR